MIFFPIILLGSSVELFKTFVLAGIDVNQQNLSRTYPLFLAVSLGAEDVVKVILDKGADVNIVNAFGKTPLIEAICCELDGIVQILLHAGANVNQICKEKTDICADDGRGNNLKHSMQIYKIPILFLFSLLINQLIFITRKL